MHTERALQYTLILGTLLLAVSNAPAGAKQGEPAGAAMHVTAVVTEKAALYDCSDPTTVKDYALKGKLVERWPVLQSSKVPTPEGFLRVEVSKGVQYCVKDYAVETDQSVTRKTDCGPVTAHRTAGTRNVGEDCNADQKSKR